MDSFTYREGRLFVENVPVAEIARAVGTPAYIYSKATFVDHLAKIQQAYTDIDTTVCFSIKACGNINILRFMAEQGSGFDVVSGGELFRAQEAGADMTKTVYAGVGKTDEEIVQALNAGIGYFNIESEAELENIIRICRKAGKKARAALRVNPDVDPKTHTYITTGKKESKFGVDIERAKRVFDTYGGNGVVNLCAVHIHLGSGGQTIDPYVEALEKIMTLVDDLAAGGHTIEAIDMGGGYGADYTTGYGPSALDYAGGIIPLLRGRGLKLILEPGKSIAANAGILLTRVLYRKTGGSKRFVIVDAGMNDLIRPPLYGAFHFIWPASVENGHAPLLKREKMELEGLETVDIVGPICEGSDFFAQDRDIPPVERGDHLAIFTAGAYGFTMSSNYNARPMAPEVLVDGDRFSVIRRRQRYEDLVQLEKPYVR